MSSYKIKGIEEIMLYHFDMDAPKFFEMKMTELKKFIDDNYENNSLQVFVLSDEKVQIGDEKKIKCTNEYSEKNYLPKIEKNKIRIVSWEGLENTDIKIDISENIQEVTIKIKGNTYGCMDEWGNRTFTDYTIHSGGKKINHSYFESESYGSVKEKVYYFLNDRGQLGSIGQSENFEEELSEIINILK